MASPQSTAYTKPDAIENALGVIGISRSDPEYRMLRDQLNELATGSVDRKKLSTFYGTYSKTMIRKLEEKDADVRALEKRLLKTDNLIRSACQRTTERILLNAAVTIKDYRTLDLMKALRNGTKNCEALKADTGLNSKDLETGMDFLLNSGVVEAHPDKCGNAYCLSEIGKVVLTIRGRDFEKDSSASVNREYQLALRAVGNDAAARRLIAWTEGHNGRKHRTKIAKLYKALQDPTKLSQSFFGYVEGGEAQQEHIGVKVVNHRAAGELLILKYSLE